MLLIKGNFSAEDYEVQTQKKEEVRAEKDADKVNLKCVFTMDLQSLLLCPMSNVSSIYYKRKVGVHII